MKEIQRKGVNTSLSVKYSLNSTRIVDIKFKLNAALIES